MPRVNISTSSLLKARTTDPALPAWYADATSNQWTTLPVGTLSASGVMETNAGLIFSAWGGGVVNTVGIYDGATWRPGIFIIVWGGGHSDYGGNEVYACGPLNTDSQAWYKLRSSTSPVPTNVSQDGSGNPVSRHTYQSITYIGGSRNWMFATGGLARYNDANGIAVSHVFQFNTASPGSNQPWTTKAVPNAAADVCAYDPTTGIIWSHQDAANEVQSYNVDTDTYSEALFKSPGWSTGNACSAIDTNRGIWAIYWSGGINFYRLNAGTGNDYYTPSTTGTAPTGSGSILWDSVADAFKVWNGNGKQIFTLTPPGANPYQGGNSWTWSSATPGAGATPDAAQTNGTFGRFSYVNNGAGLKGYVLLNSSTSSAYFYKA